MIKCLLFGGGLQVLTIARSLKEKGYGVGVLTEKENVIKHSKFLDEYVSLQSNIDNWLDELQNIILSSVYHIVIPTEDKYATFLSQNKDCIENNTKAKCAVMDWDIFSIVSDKASLLSFCKQHNIPHPKTKDINDNWDDLCAQVGFPSLIKPNFSAGARGITPVANKLELMQKAPAIINTYGECSLQEFIENNHYYNAMLYRTQDGTYGNSVVTKISRYYPIKGGSSSYCETIENPKIISICKQLLDKLQWVGFADFDILEKCEGDYRIIEVNPRIPASVRAASVSGVDFGEMIVKDYLCNQLESYQYKPGQVLRYLGLDMAWFLSSPMRFKCTPSWFKFFGENIYYQEGGCHDWIAMLFSIYEGVRKQLSSSFRKSKANMN